MSLRFYPQAEVGKAEVVEPTPEKTPGHADATSTAPKIAAITRPLLQGSETILLVQDDPDVSELVCTMREQTAAPVRSPSEQLRCAVRWFVFFSAVGLFLVGPTSAQQPIHVEVNLVNVSFTVRDSNGALAGNLTNDDFEVLEDDLPQKIAFFARSSDVPLTLGVILDVSGSQEHFTKRHEEDFEVFIKDVLGPKDRAFLLCFGNHLRLVNDYTQSGAQMFEHLKEYEKKSDRFPEIGPKEHRDLGTAFYDSIYYSVTEKLVNESGRRALLIFSDGEDNSSSHDMMTTIEAAQRENVLVFTIRYTEREHGQLTARNKYGIRVMDRIAKETGGAHIDAETTDPHTYFREIAEELRNSYELGYYPSNPLKDNTFRKLVIRPKPSGLTVRAKTGYFTRPAP